MKRLRVSLGLLRRGSAIAVALVILLILIVGGVALVVDSYKDPTSEAIDAVLAFALLAFLMRLDVERALQSLEDGRAALPVLAYAVILVLMGSTPGTTKFDEIAAQVIVVLLLALAVDARFFRLQAKRARLDTAGIVLTMMLLAVGEYCALRGLLTEDPTHAEIAAGAIAAGFTAVAISALAGPSRLPNSKSDQPS